MLRILLYIFLLFNLAFSQTVTANPPSSSTVWIYFKDKGPQENLHLYKAANLVSERSLKRRAKILPESKRIDYYDLPVYTPYIEEIEPFVKHIRIKSRWLNAVSVEIDGGQAARIKSFDFVRSVEKVKSFQRRPIPETISFPKTSIDTSDYGESFNQLNQIKVPELHKKGIYGQGTLICVLDAGFDLLYSHQAFDSLDIVATWDFTENDSDVAGHSHGTYVLSVLAGYAPGNLIGPAFKASFLLARTEVAATETPAEEDYWVAGIEWADSNGADIVSSSLGYSTFDDPIYDYTYDDLDGKTATTTIAAEIAADKGIIVFNSAGNEYNNSWRHITPPADGARVMAVGAVTRDGVRASFSSVGPTADGRIKPDIAALGVSVRAASSSNPGGYVSVSGTSFSCPLAAGAGALLVSAFPETAPEQIRRAIKQTAGQAANPDSKLGWGIINTLSAYNMLGGNGGNEDLGKISIYLHPNYPNPFFNETNILFSCSEDANVTFDVFNVIGQRVYYIDAGFYSRGSLRTYKFKLPFSISSGVYFYRITLRSINGGFATSAIGKMVMIR